MSQGIYKKVADLQERIGQFGKDKVNPHFKYKYASAENVSEKIKPLLAELGIVAQLVVKPGPTIGNVLVAEATLTLIDKEDGSSMVFGSIGSGTDSGDKHAMKAATAASKYATIAAVFGASTDDPEADAKTDAGAAAQPAPKPAQPQGNGETQAAQVLKVNGVSRTGRQPYKVDTDAGVFNTFDEAIANSIKAGSAIIYKTGRFGNDIIEVTN